MGGDSDTIAAITGAIAEACFGVPEELWAEACKRLDERLVLIAEGFGAFAQSLNEK